jgi:adenine phosphoribosyltransferase
VSPPAEAPSGTGAPLSDLIKAGIRDVPDFPSPGVLFKDITPLLADPIAMAAVVEALSTGTGPVDKVAGIEARGFIFAAPVAFRLGAGFVPVRKEGKLPAPTYTQGYHLEYGTATIEVHRDAIAPGDRVLIVDDVLATGGTARATADLVQQSGGTLVGLSVVLELEFLHGRDKLRDLDLHALVTV